MGASSGFRSWQIVPVLPRGYSDASIVNDFEGAPSFGFRIIPNPSSFIQYPVGVPILATFGDTQPLPVDAGFFPVLVQVRRRNGSIAPVIVWDDGWITLENDGIRIADNQLTYTGQFSAASFAIEWAETKDVLVAAKTPAQQAARRSSIGGGNGRTYSVAVGTTATRIDLPPLDLIPPLSNRRSITIFASPANTVSTVVGFDENVGGTAEVFQYFNGGFPLVPGASLSQVPIDSSIGMYAIVPSSTGRLYIIESGS